MVKDRTRHSRFLTRAASLAVGLLAVPATLFAGELDRPLEALIAESKLGDKVALSVTIVDAESGQTLADHEPTRPLIPASNMKLLTSAAALSVLGADFAFETELALQPDADRLVVRGAGDPALADPDLLAVMGIGVEEFLSLLAEKVGAAAHRSGPLAEIVADDRLFDRELVHPTWPDSQLNRRYCAEISGLNFQRNVIALYAEPGAVGRPPTITVEPVSPWIEVANHARSVGRDKQHTAWASRKRESNQIGFHGDVRSSELPVEVTIHDPALQFARLLADRVARAGAGSPAARVATPDENLSGGEPVYVIRTPISTVLERCNIDSQNLYAEALLKRIGHEVTGAPGSWANGAAVLRMELIERLGAWAGSEVVVADGSGMSRENRVTTRALARWLHEIGRDSEIGAAFIDSMAEAAEEGTLRKRFRKMRPEHQVRAKTGYLSGVSALSGYVIDGEGDDPGRRVVFSIISNDKPNSIPLARVRELEEKIVLMIDQWLESGELTADFGG